MRRFGITGGASLIDSAVIRHLINYTDVRVLNLYKLTCAGNLDSSSMWIHLTDTGLFKL